jgi:hypothetical protein
MYANPNNFEFSIKIFQYCPLQSWTAVDQGGRRAFKYFSEPVPSSQTVWTKFSPFRRITKHLIKYSLFPADLAQHYRRQLYSRTRQYQLDIEETNSGCLEEIISELPGRVFLAVTNEKSDLPLKLQNNTVITFSWLPPWAINEFRKSTYIELDTSFRAIKPYVYCIPMGIHANESFPLAIIIGLSESIELYDLFFSSMLKLGIDLNELRSKPYLSDQHSALLSVCSDKRHFLCLRHLIERFGTKSFLGQMARRLAFSSTQLHFLTEIEQVTHDITELIENNEVTFGELTKFEIFGIKTRNGELSIDTDIWEPQAIWTRAQFGVSTCSNHSEGFHRFLNETTRGYLLLNRRISAMVEAINNRYLTASQYNHTQGKRVLKRLACEQERLAITPCRECSDPMCGWGIYYKALMNVPWFLCVHEVGSDEVQWCQPPEVYMMQIVANQSPEVVEYQGHWNIPRVIKKDATTDPEVDHWDSGGSDTDSFIISLAREVIIVSNSKIGLLRLISMISMSYPIFLEEQNATDCLESRSAYRVKWWIMARDNELPS